LKPLRKGHNYKPKPGFIRKNSDENGFIKSTPGLTGDAVRARFEVVTSLEEEALHVVVGVVVDAEHGEELAVGDPLALLLAGHL
jgi:hypothetical protein